MSSKKRDKALGLQVATSKEGIATIFQWELSYQPSLLCLKDNLLEGEKAHDY